MNDLGVKISNGLQIAISSAFKKCVTVSRTKSYGKGSLHVYGLRLQVCFVQAR